MNTADMHRLPFTSELMIAAEFEEWIASRKAAGAAIDIETCEIGHHPVNNHNPYGIPGYEDRWPENVEWSIDLFVRSPDSRGWVHEGGLSLEKYRAMMARMSALRERGLSTCRIYYSGDCGERLAG
jgi:hypothetical protein